MPGLLLPLYSMLQSLRITEDDFDNPQVEVFPNGVIAYGSGINDGGIFTVPSTTEPGLRYTVFRDPVALGNRCVTWRLPV